MSSDVNKPTGQGYIGSPYRECTRCHHLEINHYGSTCYGSLGARNGYTCHCQGFCARELSPEEQAVLDAVKIEDELRYVGEKLYIDLIEDVKKRG